MGRDRSSVTYVKRASLSWPTSRNITWSTLERNHMNVRYVVNHSLSVFSSLFTSFLQSLIIIIIDVDVKSTVQEKHTVS